MKSTVFKCSFAVLTVLFIMFLCLIYFTNDISLEEEYKNEMNTIQAIGGKIIKNHPETENDFVEALKFYDESSQSLGEEILNKYGYHFENIVFENEIYHRRRNQQRILLIGALTAVIGLISFISIYFIRERKTENDFLLAMIESFLSENYTFSDESMEEKKGYVDNSLSLIVDRLKQLGRQVYLKNIIINEEKESIKSLVTDISHQLKTPIASLKTCFSMYLEADTNEEREEFLTRSGYQIDRLEGLTNALVNISRLEMAMINLKPERVLLNDILIDAVNVIYEKAMKKGIEMELEPCNAIYLELDKKWTTEAIANILDNAVKYSFENGLIKISVQQMVSFIRVEIKDTGIGIKKEECNKIFQRFYRSADSIVKQTEGSGVGLYLTRFILEKQGGSIFVQSIYEKGSTFILQLRI